MTVINIVSLGSFYAQKQLLKVTFVAFVSVRHLETDINNYSLIYTSRAENPSCTPHVAVRTSV